MNPFDPAAREQLPLHQTQLQGVQAKDIMTQAGEWRARVPLPGPSSRGHQRPTGTSDQGHHDPGGGTRSTVRQNRH